MGRAVDLGQMHETDVLPSRPNKLMDAMTTAHFDVDGECVAAQGRAIKDLADSHFEQVVSRVLELNLGSSEMYHTVMSVVDDPPPQQTKGNVHAEGPLACCVRVMYLVTVDPIRVVNRGEERVKFRGRR